MDKFSIEEIAKKYNVNLKELEKEQTKLTKTLSIKDSIDFSLADRIGAINTIFIANQIISGVIICDSKTEIIEQEYFQDKVKFPYIPGFRAYRELPTMISAFNKLEEKPDIVLISGHGIAHSRLGLASHFSISTNIPTIGIANKLLIGKVKKDNIILNNKKVGKVLISKEGSSPLYISPGNLISIKTAFEFVKNLIQLPHKLPEPLHLAHKYVRDIKKELKL